MSLNSRSTAADALRGADLTGKVAVVTGGASGIGTETVRALASAGCNTVICARNRDAANKVAEEITKDGVKGTVSVERLDLTDLASIRECAQALQSQPRIDYLILNAGVMAAPLTRTAAGWELQMATNHIGHFYLTQLLLPKLQGQGSPCRIIVLSSLMHAMLWRFSVDDLNWERRSYSPMRAYNQSKACNVLFARELDRRLKAQGAPIEAFSVHPGVISTNLGRHLSRFYSALQAVAVKIGVMPGTKNIQQGAATTVYAALAPELEGKGGAYLADCSIARAGRVLNPPELPAQLWEKTEELIKEALEKGL